MTASPPPCDPARQARARRVRARRDRARHPDHPQGPKVVTRALPHLLERIVDRSLPDAALSPIERAAREWRQEVIADLGGPEAVPATKWALVNAVTGTKILLDSIDRYVFELAAQDGLVSRRNRRAFAIVADRMRVADSLARQLAALGMERHAPPVPSLTEYLAQRKGDRDGSAADTTLPTNQTPAPGGDDEDDPDRNG